MKIRQYKSILLIFSLFIPTLTVYASSDSVNFTSTYDFSNTTVVNNLTTSNDKVELNTIDFVSLSAGYQTLGIKSDGTLWAWGYNGYGQLGLGDTATRSVPTQVGVDNHWSKVVVSNYEHTVALKTDGTLWAWGYNFNGQNGQGTHDGASHSTPTKIGTDTDWTDIAVGADHALAVKSNGTLWAWGKNLNYQLGVGDNTDKYSPTQVGTDTDWSSVAGKSTHSYALKTNHTLWSWGGNASGQLGVGDLVFRGTPTQVGTDTDWSAIYGNGAGSASVATKLDGNLYTWGDNTLGQLGVGDTTNKQIPTEVMHGTSWKSIAVGNSSITAVTSSGALYSWGSNASGQLGIGSRDSFTHSSPVQIGSDTDWDFAVAGYEDVVAVKTTGTYWGWGYNGFSELGFTTTDPNYILSPTQIGSLTTWTEVTSNRGHSIGLKSDHTLWAWGNNNYGQLGLNDLIARSTPTQIGSGSDWAKVAHSVGTFGSAAIKSNGTLWTWGLNANGQLGHNDIVNKSVPTQVGVGTDWADVWTSEYSTVALKTDGTLWAWGWNANGQLGLGDVAERHIPAQIGVDTDWVSGSIGIYQILALKSNGTLWTSGFNNSGQLGLGDLVPRNTITQIGTDTDWSSAIAGYFYAMALKTDGTLWSWGNNGFFQLGLGDAVLRNVPTKVGTDTDWSEIAVTRYNSGALKSDGTLWTWGTNDYGQLGQGDHSSRAIPTKVGIDTDWASLNSAYTHFIALKTNSTLWGWGQNAYNELGNVNLTFPFSPTNSNMSNSYLSSGTISGLKINAGNGGKASWNSLNWETNALSAGTQIDFRVRTSDDNITYSDWSASMTQDTLASTEGSANLGQINSSHYLELELTLTTSNSNNTPTLNSFTVNYSIPNSSTGTSAMAMTNFKIQQSLLAPPSVVDLNTKEDVNRIPFSLNKVFKYGMTGDEIKMLQKYLNTHNFIVATTGKGSPLHETNYFGKKTQAAVIKFQKFYKLNPDGVVGNKTINEINKNI